MHLRSLRAQMYLVLCICYSAILCMYLVPQIWRWINEISKVCYEETQKNVVSENSCSKYFVNFQEKHPGEIAFLNKIAGYLTLTGNTLNRNVLLGNLRNFQNRFHKKHRRMPTSAISCCWKMFQPKDIF